METLYVIQRRDQPTQYLKHGKRWGRLFEARTWRTAVGAEKHVGEHGRVVKTDSDKRNVDRIQAITIDKYAPF